MLTINPINSISKKTIVFGKNKQNINNAALDKNYDNKINFEKDLFITRSADSVQSNPLKAVFYSFVKTYNIITTPKRNFKNDNRPYIHVPYWA